PAPAPHPFPTRRSSDLRPELTALRDQLGVLRGRLDAVAGDVRAAAGPGAPDPLPALVATTRDLVASATRTYDTALGGGPGVAHLDRKSTRLNSSHDQIS